MRETGGKYNSAEILFLDKGPSDKFIALHRDANQTCENLHHIMMISGSACVWLLMIEQYTHTKPNAVQDVGTVVH